jgi:hypothetical protein
VGLGSVAKGEATPYSDLEYAFIVEQDDEYFEKLAVDSYFRIGNLGESPLKTFDIDELKVTKGQPPLYICNITVGYRIDGITDKAGNIPTGRRKGGQTLTLTVEGLMELYKASAEAPFDGKAGDMSDMLSSSVVVYTNEEDVSQLHKDFEEARTQYVQTEARNSKSVSNKRLKSFTQDIHNYTFLPEFVKYQPPKNLDVRVKTDIFRYPTLLANNIKICLGWNLNYSWEIYSNLHAQEMLSDQNHQYVNIVLALSIYLRTSAYLDQGTQTEVVQIDPSFDGSLKELYVVPVNLFVILSCLLVPIKQSLTQYFEKLTNTTDEEVHLDSQVSSMIENIKVVETDYLLKVEVLYFTGQYFLAKKVLSRGIGLPGGLQSCSKVIEKIQRHGEIISSRKYVELICYLQYYTDDYGTALDYFDWLITAQQGDIGLWKLLSAHCKKELGDYQASRQLLNEVSLARN